MIFFSHHIQFSLISYPFIQFSLISYLLQDDTILVYIFFFFKSSEKWKLIIFVLKKIEELIKYQFMVLLNIRSKILSKSNQISKKIQKTMKIINYWFFIHRLIGFCEKIKMQAKQPLAPQSSTGKVLYYWGCNIF